MVEKVEPGLKGYELISALVQKDAMCSGDNAVIEEKNAVISHKDAIISQQDASLSKQHHTPCNMITQLVIQAAAIQGKSTLCCVLAHEPIVHHRSVSILSF